ncbi:MAG: response regulator [Xanthomonadaceae bacterium]|nr:response regulator [Xanthomonadaceae bacterium]MDE1963643.1 response regulator [Xanthomonadaceae bacterium]
METARAVLVVDDDPSVLETMRVLLEGRAGFRVITALGTRGALGRLHGLASLDLLVVDVDASDDPAGVALCHEAIRRHPRAALVVMSCDGPVAAPLPDAAVSLRKPFGAEDLMRAIEAATQRVQTFGEVSRAD